MCKTIKVLYISYDGAMDPLGESQIVPYLKGLAMSGVEVTLLSFEKPRMLKDIKRINTLNASLKDSHINWSILRYHKKPSVTATFYDILKGVFRAFSLSKRKNIDFIHARGYIPALIAYSVKKMRGVKYIFDMRGLWADEKVDAGSWPRGSWLYKITKGLERILLINSDRIVVLTRRVKNIIENFSYMKYKDRQIAVIPTCVDLKRFNVKDKDKGISKLLNTEDKFVLSYLGSTGTWYMLDEMIDFFKITKLKLNNSFFLLLVNTDKKAVEGQISRRGLAREDYCVTQVPHEDVPRWLSVADASVFFIKPSFSKKGSCATKFGESLACRVPVVVNSEVGDTDEIVRSEKIGVVIDKFNADSYRKGLDELLDLMKDKDRLRVRCRNAAEEMLSLDYGIDSFYRIYKNLTKD